jgi:hypothetical protein
MQGLVSLLKYTEHSSRHFSKGWLSTGINWFANLNWFCNINWFANRYWFTNVLVRQYIGLPLYWFVSILVCRFIGLPVYWFADMVCQYIG